MVTLRGGHTCTQVANAPKLLFEKLKADITMVTGGELYHVYDTDALLKVKVSQKSLLKINRKHNLANYKPI